MSSQSITYKGPIFDAHTHVIDIDALKLLVQVEDEFGIDKAMTIVHGDSIREYEEAFPGRFIYARYFSGWTLFTEGPKQAIEDVRTLRERGYGMAKMHFAPFWSDRLADIKHVPPIDSHDFDVLFDVLMDEDIPVLVHIADPDTYFATRYTDTKMYGTKEDHISEFENRLHRSKDLRFQAAHFAAQPEPHRLQNLARMFDNYPNLNVDLSSARWMCREFGRSPEQARAFLIKYVDRILFATDCVASSIDRSYYEGRHSSLRLLLESDIEKEPLPFVDKDTVNSGGTFIYGLNLPENILEKLYWKNAEKLHNLQS